MARDLYEELGMEGMASFQPATPFKPDYNTTLSTLRSVIQDPNIPESQKGTAYQNIGPMLEQQAADEAARAQLLEARRNDFSALQSQGMNAAAKFGIVSPNAPSLIPPQSQVAQAGDAVPSSPMPAVPSLEMPQAPSMMPAPQMNLTNPYMEGANLEGKKGAFNQDILSGLQKEQEAQMAKEQERQRQQQVEFDNYKTEISNAQKEIDEVSSRDPARDRPLFAKIGAAIAMGLGAYAAAINRTPNYAAQVIDDAIKSDLAHQKQLIEKAKGKMDVTNNTYAMLRSKISDERAADAAYYASRLSQAQMKINAFAEGLRGEEAKANARVLNQQLEGSKVKAQAELDKVMAETAKLRSEAGAGAEQPGAVGLVKKLPKDLQQEGYKELKAAEDFQKTKDDVLSAFKETMKIGPSGAIPSYLGGNKEAYQSMKGKMAGAIIGKVPGIKSDKDFEEVIVPQLPGMLETGPAAEAKLKSFESWINAQSPSTPLLTSIGYAGPKASISAETTVAPRDISINGKLIPKGTKLQKVAGGWQPIQ